MSPESIDLVIKVILPVATGVLGFVGRVTWERYAQRAKARDNLLWAISRQRSRALTSLWAHTMQFQRLNRVDTNEGWRTKQDIDFTSWYFQEAGALFLSWRATKLYFKALKTLRRPLGFTWTDRVRELLGFGASDPDKRRMQKAFSSLRTQLKRDIGIYSARDARRQLKSPPAPLGGGQLPPASVDERWTPGLAD